MTKHEGKGQENKRKDRKRWEKEGERRDKEGN